jgi:hypothetical protein
MFLFITAAAAAAMTPTTAGTPRTLDMDGVRATYTRSVDADGTVHLRGRYTDGDNSAFHFRVRGRQVEGRRGNEIVAFQLPRA